MSKFFRSKMLLAVALGVFLFFAVALAKMLYKNYEIEREVRRLEHEITRTELKNDEIARLVEYFPRSENLEKEARLRLNLKRPDEEVLILPPEPAAGAQATASPSSSPPGSYAAYLREMVRKFFNALR